MSFEDSYNSRSLILMEGALGERLKREYNIDFDDDVAMAGLIYDLKSRVALKDIWSGYINIAETYHLPFMATTPTRRANKERVLRSKFEEKIIIDNVRYLQHLRELCNADMFVGGLMGCKGDAYKATKVLTAAKAEEFHSWQANLFKEANADFLFAGIMPALPEAIGMAKAMDKTGLPYIISFMIRNNGRLIDGTTINDAILHIDNETKRKPICYMTNCVHPLVLRQALSCPFNQTELVKTRFHGIQTNTSPLSPEELDNSDDLKASDSISLAADIVELKKGIDLKIVGGCCGTDNTHIDEIAKRLTE